MTSPVFSVLEGDGGVNSPEWPTEEHFGGLLFEDDPQYPPTDRKRLSATDYMQLEMSVARACRMIPPLTVDFIPGTTPNVPAILFVNCTNDAITTTTATITRTGEGIYEIEIPEQTLPPRRLNAQIRTCGTATSPSIGGYVTQSANAGVVTFACHVYNNFGELTDDPAFQFSLWAFGE
jgi:hypothetical protein